MAKVCLELSEHRPDVGSVDSWLWFLQHSFVENCGEFPLCCMGMWWKGCGRVLALDCSSLAVWWGVVMEQRDLRHTLNQNKGSVSHGISDSHPCPWFSPKNPQLSNFATFYFSTAFFQKWSTAVFPKSCGVVSSFLTRQNEITLQPPCCLMELYFTALFQPELDPWKDFISSPVKADVAELCGEEQSHVDNKRPKWQLASTLLEKEPCFQFSIGSILLDLFNQNVSSWSDKWK